MPRLPLPIESQYRERYSSDSFEIATIRQQGWRNSFEDNLSVAPSLSKEHNQILLLSVFDGHSGSFTSNYLMEHFSSHLSLLPHDLLLGKDNDIALKQSILLLDSEIITQQLTPQSSDKIMPTDTSGSTLLFCLIDLSNNNLNRTNFLPSSSSSLSSSSSSSSSSSVPCIIGSLGDSKIYIINGSTGELRFENKIHSPSLKEEKKRIEKAGGNVIANRVDGRLAMSRAMGDPQRKGLISDDNLLPSSSSFHRSSSINLLETKVSADCDISHCSLKEGDYILLCTDGLIEEWTGEELVNIIHQKMKNAKKEVWKQLTISSEGSNVPESAEYMNANDLRNIVSEIVNEGYQKGSTDNITAILFRLNESKNESELLFHQASNLQKTVLSTPFLQQPLREGLMEEIETNKNKEDNNNSNSNDSTVPIQSVPPNPPHSPSSSSSSSSSLPFFIYKADFIPGRFFSPILLSNPLAYQLWYEHYLAFANRFGYDIILQKAENDNNNKKSSSNNDDNNNKTNELKYSLVKKGDGEAIRWLKDLEICRRSDQLINKSHEYQLQLKAKQLFGIDVEQSMNETYGAAIDTEALLNDKEEQL